MATPLFPYPDGGLLLAHDNLTHLQGEWIELDSLTIDLRNGLIVGENSAHLLTIEQLALLKRLVTHKIVDSNFYTTSEWKSAGVHLTHLRKHLAYCADNKDTPFIVNNFQSYTLGVAAKAAMPPSLTPFALEALSGKSETLAWNKAADRALRGESPGLTDIPPLPAQDGYGQIHYDLAKNCAFLAGIRLNAIPSALPLLAALVYAAKRQSGPEPGLCVDYVRP